MDDRDGRLLSASSRPLCEVYDTAVLDLDGVVYVGPAAVPGAPEHLSKACAAGMHPAYVTNNASRPPSVVAQHLRELGLPAEDADVVTSAQAAARMVAALVPEGAAVLLVGGDGLAEALREHGLRPVPTLADRPEAVVQGFSPDVGWRALAEAVAAVDTGLPWVASNLDRTVPVPQGRAPGNGLLVEVVAGATGQRPRVAGKPERALFDETLLRVGGERPLVIGDRLDTDIEGAVECGWDSLLVMTGVTDVPTLCTSAPGCRPTYVSHDLSGLLRAHPPVQVREERDDDDTVVATCGGWTCRVSSRGVVTVRLSGAGDRDDALRASASACWHASDRTGRSPATEQVDAAWRAAAGSPGH